jgi:WD40 repeat protein
MSVNINESSYLVGEVCLQGKILDSAVDNAIRGDKEAAIQGLRTGGLSQMQLAKVKDVISTVQPNSPAESSENLKKRIIVALQETKSSSSSWKIEEKASFSSLPDDPVFCILTQENLDLMDVACCSLVSKRMYVITDDDKFWKVVFRRCYGWTPFLGNALPRGAYVDLAYKINNGVYGCHWFFDSRKESVSFIISEDRLISSFLNGSIEMWDLNTRQQMQTFGESKDATIAASPNGTLLAARSLNMLRFWDTATGECMGNLPCRGPFKKAIFFIENKCFFGSNINNKFTIECYDLGTQKLLKPLEGHTGWVSHFACAGGKLISSSVDGTIRIWDLQKWECCGVLNTRALGRLAVEPEEGGLLVFTFSHLGQITIWDLESCGSLGTLPITGVADYILETGQLFLERKSSNKEVEVWDWHSIKNSCYSSTKETPMLASYKIKKFCEGATFPHLDFVHEKLYSNCKNNTLIADFTASYDEILRELSQEFDSDDDERITEAGIRLQRLPQRIQKNLQERFRFYCSCGIPLSEGECWAVAIKDYLNVKNKKGSSFQMSCIK